MVTILTRISCETIVLSARAVWVNQEIADNIASDAQQILAKASSIKLRFFNAKTQKCLLGGLFSLSGYRYDAPRTHREIANTL